MADVLADDLIIDLFYKLLNFYEMKTKLFISGLALMAITTLASGQNNGVSTQSAKWHRERDQLMWMPIKTAFVIITKTGCRMYPMAGEIFIANLMVRDSKDKDKGRDCDLEMEWDRVRDRVMEWDQVEVETGTSLMLIKMEFVTFMRLL